MVQRFKTVGIWFVVTLATSIVTAIGKSIWSHVSVLKAWLKFFTYSIPVWLVLLIILVLFVVSVAVNAVVNHKTKDTRPAWQTKYISDVIDGIQWQWRWLVIGSSVKLVNLEPLCPKCKSTLQEKWMTSGISSAYCPHCKEPKTGFVGSDYKENIEAELIRRLRTDEWKAHLKRIEAAQ